jgi:hypothetical protein
MVEIAMGNVWQDIRFTVNPYDQITDVHLSCGYSELV